MALSNTAQGVCAELEFIKLAILGSNGLLGMARPVADDDGQDVQVRVRDVFDIGLAFQVKSVLKARRRQHGQASILRTRFEVRKDGLKSHPLFWYFFAVLDRESMRFTDPVFIVPSSVVHTKGKPLLRRDKWALHFDASLAPDSHDKWVRYRVDSLKVGQRIMEIVRDYKRKGRKFKSDPLLGGSGLLWVGIPRGAR